MKFDAAYYDRFYKDPSTRATSSDEQATLAAFIVSYLRYLEIEVGSILDIGCGLGDLLNNVHRAFPDAKATGVDISEYLCETYGWHLGSVIDYQDKPHNVVICSDVLGYLGDKACAKAIKNLATLCASALYLSVLTEEDLAICDQNHTDMRQQARPYEWYQQRLSKYFVSVGGGLFLRKPLQTSVWRLERT